ncbi:hypothetical protein SAMN05720470_102140 [Fibrobacter sp. UWOV1]|uniref:hypothetical protein n=1 Tax=Fibrobacter sp. UWOV1 TaxID=1896215 RepID=UPI0009241663|nr:hypothetical protein [Fibrobacter sp. UWOV1]SHK70820.1 hypothetical protein SAMN05720470_102140 [Fibrobacter sp. UWOV1]
MRNRIVIILLSLLLATPALAGVGAFQKFSMGIMLGLGPSYMTGEDADLYDDNWSAGGGVAFRMAFPVASRMSVLVDLGVDGAFGFSSEYEYQHRTVKDSVMTNAWEITVLWDYFATDNFFVAVGPCFRFPFVEEKVELDDDEIYSDDEIDYANDFWFDAMFAFGWKYDGIEFGLRTGYEFLGMFKETGKYKSVDINELRFRLYMTYWFGQKRN